MRPGFLFALVLQIVVACGHGLSIDAASRPAIEPAGTCARVRAHTQEIERERRREGRHDPMPFFCVLGIPDGSSLRPRGLVRARWRFDPTEECAESARVVFVDDRVFALLRNELVEVAQGGDEMVARHRVELAPSSTPKRS